MGESGCLLKGVNVRLLQVSNGRLQRQIGYDKKMRD